MNRAATGSFSRRLRIEGPWSRRGVLGAAAILLASLLAVFPLFPSWSACLAASRQLAANRRRHRRVEKACSARRPDVEVGSRSRRYPSAGGPG